MLILGTGIGLSENTGVRHGGFLFISVWMFSSKHNVFGSWELLYHFNLVWFFLGVNERSSFLEAVQFFLETIALHDIHTAEQCFDCSSKGSMFSPQERDVYNYSKCTIIVRTMEFVTMILETCQQDFWKVCTEICSG